MPMMDMPLDQLQTYRGISPRAGDFDAYWAEALAGLDTVDPQPVLEPAGIPCKTARMFDLYYTGVGGARIHARYLRPKDEGPHPCVLAFHGYTARVSDWADYLPWVAQGFCVAAMSCRGQADGLSQDPANVSGNTFRGHIVRGLADGPKALTFRSVFLDTVQLQRTVTAFKEVDPARLVTMGGSQGGALSTACSALAQGVVLSLICYPFLSDYKRVWEMDYSCAAYEELKTWFRHNDPLHAREDEFFRSLSYIDVHHLAPRIKNRAVVALCLMDTVCPPSTQFAVYNSLGGEKQALVYPDFGHEALPGWQDTMLRELARV